ncbi:MAG: MBL fold metallo-hydrolase [Nanohaloarchaea archaeon]|nr:MBL fold metallo-hydrolase [Candidatus Nanohaloarchaea archaeon]
MADFDGFNINWEGLSTVRIEDAGFTVAVDPVKDSEFSADIILVTGNDPEHFDPETIDKVSNGRTCVVVPKEIDRGQVPLEDTESIGSGETIDVYGVEIEAVGPSDSFGYRFRMRDKDFYIPGKLELDESLMDIEGCVDIAFLPVNGEMLDVDEAVKAAVMIKPSTVIPYHRDSDDREVDLKAFQAEVEDRNIGFSNLG